MESEGFAIYDAMMQLKNEVDYFMRDKQIIQFCLFWHKFPLSYSSCCFLFLHLKSLPRLSGHKIYINFRSTFVMA